MLDDPAQAKLPELAMNALKEAALYIDVAQPLLKASQGICYSAVFITPDPEAVREQPETFPQVRAAYVLSLLERSHWASIATIARNCSWLSAVIACRQSNNLLGFSASLRGFLEASADSHDVLRYLPRALLEAREFLYCALHEPSSINVELGLGGLEDRLIHFAFARKQPRGSSNPQVHCAKSNADYIRQIESFGVADATNLYAELCELTHPASPSVDCFLDSFCDHFQLNFEKDKASIDDLIGRYDEAISKLSMYSFNPALACLAFLARIVPVWPAPSSDALQGIPYAKENIPLFDELFRRYGHSTLFEGFGR